MYIIYTSSQKTRHQKLNSYWVMNSLGDKICPPAAPSTPVNKIQCVTINPISHEYVSDNMNIQHDRFYTFHGHFTNKAI